MTGAPARDIRDMTVHLVRDLDELEALGPEWDALHALDPQAGAFLRWGWLMRGFRDAGHRATVLAVRAEDHAATLVGLLPLKSRVHWSRSRKEYQTQYQPAGRLLGRTQAGFLCAPGWEVDVIAACAETLSQVPWTELSLGRLGQGGRGKRFRSCFDKTVFSVSYSSARSPGGEGQPTIAADLSLPASFQAFLDNHPSASARDDILSVEKRFLETGKVQLVDTSPGRFNAHLAILLSMWSEAELARRGKALSSRAKDGLQRILSEANDAGVLFMPMLVKDGQPLGVVAHLVDRDLGRVHAVQGGRAPSEVPVQTILHMASIEWAIAHGFGLYDFGQVEAADAARFGAGERKLRSLSIRRRVPARGQALDSANAAEALTRVLGHIRAGRQDQAVTGCEQVIAALSAE